MTDEKKVETKRSLIDGLDGRPYPDVPLDSSSSFVNSKTISAGRVWRTDPRTGRNNHKNNDGLLEEFLDSNRGIYSIIASGHGKDGATIDIRQSMPGVDHDALTSSGHWKTNCDYNIYYINDVQHRHKLLNEAGYHGAFAINRRKYLKVLADFSDKNTDEMTYREKEALIMCLLSVGYPLAIVPEVFTRFINPVGSIGNKPSYEGVTAYFFDLGHRLQHYAERYRFARGFHIDSNWRTNEAPFSIDLSGRRAMKAIDKYFSDNEHMKLHEAAKLLGKAAKRWKIDTAKSEASFDNLDQVSSNIIRFYYYLFVSKALQLIKERTDPEHPNPHPNLVIEKEDMNDILDYASGKYLDKLHIDRQSLTKAERDLMGEIDKMMTPGSREYGEMQRLLDGGDGIADPRYLKSRLPHYGMMQEKYHAMNFLYSNHEEGKKLIWR